jgi:hypothetical protein|tara:strand:- start:426 stop:635 length:210 start_codon:yes stop_codon:yes gene_type:complete
MYGQGIFTIDNVRIKNGKLMFDCVDTAEVDGDNTRTIFMDAEEAQALVNEIYWTAQDYQNELRRKLQNA